MEKNTESVVCEHCSKDLEGREREPVKASNESGDEKHYCCENCHDKAHDGESAEESTVCEFC